MADLNPPPRPPRSYGHVSIAVLAAVAVLALAAAWGALVAIERISGSAVERALFLAGEDWAEVETNGLQVILSGDAPSEAARFAALSAAGHEVDGARVIDAMVLPEAVAIEPPRFSVEMLRNEAGISLIGLIPAGTDREALTQRMRAIDPIQPVADFLETAEYPTPEGWDNALDFTLDMAAMLPRSKISVSADTVAVEAIATSADQKREWEQAIRRAHPAGLRLALDIRAPLDVISPYIVRFLSDEQGARFDACTAYTPADRNRIISAGIAAGVKGAVDCTIGLGVPSPDWPEAVSRGIRAVRDMGGGSLTFSDADVTVIAPADTPQDTFDRVVGELEADLPEVFSLHAVLTEPETGPTSPEGRPEFIASLAETGAVQLRGRVASEQDRTIVETLARARFGTKAVYAPLRLDPALPASWAVRTLAGLEALDQLADGRVVVRPDVVTVSGTTGDRGASAAISRLLSEKLGEAEDFRVNVKYEEALDPIAAMPTPQECVTDVNGVLARNKITFAPGSAEIERGSAATVDQIAEILKTCPDVAMEIGGYTDSQGREEMNQALSQRRAEAVVSALLARRVLTTNLKAFGYGEENPIADNDTEEGREANRRIEFSLVGEASPRAEPGTAGGDNPTMRPPARPSTDTGDDAAEAVEEAPDGAPEDSEETPAEAAPDVTPDVAPETAAQPEDAPETVSGEGEPETGAEDGSGDVDGETNPEAPVAETVTETPVDEGAPEGAPADEVAPATPEATETTPEGEAETAAETPQVLETAETGAEAEESGSGTDPADGTGAAEAGAMPAEALPVQAAETEPGTDDAAATVSPPEDLAPADLDAASSDLPDAAQDTAAGADGEGEGAGPSDVVAETLATDATATTDEATDGSDPAATGTAPDEAAPTGTPEEAVAAAELTEEATPGLAPETPTQRPRARPPVVVHPDLEGVRPRPRPASIPDAPSTE